MVRRYRGWDLVPRVTNNTDHHHTEVKWLESPSAAPLMDGLWWKYSNLHTASPRLIFPPNSPAADIVTLDRTMLCSALQPDGKTLISICYCLQAGVSSYRIDNNKCHFLHLFEISCILIVRVSGPALMCAHSILYTLQCIKLLVSACDGSTRVVMTF